VKKYTLWFALLSLSSCISLPDIYLVDRHTVMEVEASGEWPELEQRFLSNSVNKGPVNLAKEPNEKRQDKAFNMLNGEFPMTGDNP